MLQPLTTAWYNSLVLSFSLLKIQRHLIKHRSFLHVRAVEGSTLSFADGAAEVLHVQVQILYCLLYKVIRASSGGLVFEIKCNTHTHENLTKKQHIEDTMLMLIERSILLPD